MVVGDRMDKVVNIEVGAVRFKCPSCGKTEVIRVKHDRKIAAPYKCKECGFEGPN
jgi:predicted RNA-binding Zn-ribbon protein involved in translation (DUF1610 family)